MATKQSPGNREAKIAKAGKRSGGYNEPPRSNPDNMKGRENGEQQFLSKEQLTVKKEIRVLDWDKSLKIPIFRNKTVTTSVDYLNDAARKHLIISPVKDGKNQ